MNMTDTSDTFESYRPLMFAIAYRMLGSAMEAEDIVQEAFLRYQAADHVESPKAFLSTVVTHLCLDQLKSAQAKREEYVGPWLPEPLLTPATPFDSRYESISMAFLVLLESLTPVERAVFLLREVFDYDYREIAHVVGKEEAACRQLFHRARQHVAEHRPRFQASREEHQQMLEKFMQVAMNGDLAAMTDLLTEDISLYSDGGGKASAATRPLYGRDVVGRMLHGLWSRAPATFTYQIREVNGRPALVVFDEQHQPFLISMFEVEEGRISKLFIMRNPDKMRLISEE